jgi:hypothetical protein
MATPTGLLRDRQRKKWEAARALATAHGTAAKEHAGQPFIAWANDNPRYFGVPHPSRPGFSRQDLVEQFDVFVLGNL